MKQAEKVLLYSFERSEMVQKSHEKVKVAIWNQQKRRNKRLNMIQPILFVSKGCPDGACAA